MVFAVSAGTVGVAALTAGPARAAGDASSCGGALQPQCQPAAIFSPATTASSGGDEQVTVTWTPASGLSIYQSPPPSLTIQWFLTTKDPPAGAPTPVLGSVAATPSCTQTQPSAPLTCTYDWPSSLAVDGYVLNGTYTLTASAKDCLISGIGCSNAKTASTTVGVANPPQPPTNVMATLASPASAGVNITWTPSPEPDVVGYQVLRNNGSTACTLFTYPPPSAYACTDTTSGGGSFTYHVVAVRYGATYDSSAERTTTSPPTASVTVPGPPATSTTVPKGGTVTLTQPGFTATPIPTKIKTSGGTGTFGAAPAPAPAAITTTTSGGAFSPVLPYGQQSTSPSSADPQALGVPKPASKSGSPIGTIAAIGAGLLIAVIALHGLWLRSEVRRADSLEPLDPEV